MLSARVQIGCWVGVSLFVQGCGGSDTSISISPKSLGFLVTGGSGGTQTKTVTTTFRGDGVVAGYAPEVSPPSWLTVEQTGAVTTTNASFALTASAGFMIDGTFMTSVRFVTGRLPANGVLSQSTQIVSVDLPVTFTVSDFGVTPPSIALAAIDGSDAGPTPSDARSFKIAGPSAKWTATSDSPWLVLPVESGTGPFDLGFTVSATGVASGNHTATITVNDDTSGASISVTVSLTVAPPQLTTNTASLAFAIDGSTNPGNGFTSQSFTVSDQLGSADATRAISWTVGSIDVPWIASATPTSGSSAMPTDVAVSLDLSQLAALANGSYAGHLTLKYTTEDGQSHTLPVTANLTVALPRVHMVAPYVSYVGSAQDLIIRGEGFSAPNGQKLLFGTLGVTTWQLVNDTEVRVGAPDLPAGDVLVAFSNALGIKTSAVRLVMRDAAALPAATIVATGSPAKIFYDDERQIVYGIQQGSVERFGFQNNTWTTFPPITVTNLRDAALSTDGQTLVLVTYGSGIYELDLGTSGASARQTTIAPYLFTTVAFTNHGLAILTSGINGTGFTPTYTYDLTTKQATPLAGNMAGSLVSFGRAFATGDGRRVLLGQNGVSPPQAVIAYDSSTDHSSNTPISASITTLSLDRDGSRLVVNGGPVYDDTYTLLGQLGGEIINVLSPNGERAYGYTYNTATGVPIGVAVYNLAGQTDSNGQFPTLPTIATSASIQTASVGPVRMAISGDGHTLFVRGNNALQVIPLSP